MTEQKQEKLEEKLDFPEETQEFYRQAAVIIRREIGRSKKMQYRYLRKKPTLFFPTREAIMVGYSFAPILENEGKVRWPHEIKGGCNCFEHTILMYGFTRELGMSPTFNIIEDMAVFNVGSKQDEDKIVSDHASLELILYPGRGTKMLDYNMGLNGTIYRRGAREVRVRRDNNGKKKIIKFSNYYSISLPELIRKIQYLRSPKGVMMSLSQNQRLSTFHTIEGNYGNYVRYDMCNNTIVNGIDNNRELVMNRHFDNIIELDDKGDVKKRYIDVYMTKKNTWYSSPLEPKFLCTLDYKLVEDLYNAMPRKIKRSRRSKWIRISKIIQKIFDRDYDAQLEKDTGLNRDQLEELSGRIDKHIEENYRDIVGQMSDGKISTKIIGRELLLGRSIYEARLKKAKEQGQDFVYSEKEKKDYMNKLLDEYSIAINQQIDMLSSAEKQKQGFEEEEKGFKEKVKEANKSANKLISEVHTLGQMYATLPDYYERHIDLVMFSKKLKPEVIQICEEKICAPDQALSMIAQQEGASMYEAYRALVREQLTTLTEIYKRIRFKPYLKQTQKTVKNWLEYQKEMLPLKSVDKPQAL